MTQRWLILRLVLRRLMFLPFAVFAAVTISFALVNLVPGNPAKVIAGSASSPAEVASISHRLGLDQPLWLRYWHYLQLVAHGNLGLSYFSQLPVTHEIALRLPATLELVIPSLIFAVVIALTVGIVTSAFHGRMLDNAISGVISFFQGMPDFLLGNILIFILFFKLRLLASPTGQLSLGVNPPPHHTGAYVLDAILSNDWSVAGDAAAHLILPVMTLTLAIAAPLSRTARAAFIEATTSSSLDYARSLGLKMRTQWLYIWREARGPIMTYGAFIFAALIGGDAIIEVVFSWGGIGSWSVTSIEQLDLPVTEGFVVVVSTATILVYMLLDVANLFLDPRVRQVPVHQDSRVVTAMRRLAPFGRSQLAESA
jgi:ABC-type dipeptide/oligopeptide/nickel transport system permease component